MKFQKLHDEAQRLSKNYFKAEAELLDVFQRIDAAKAYREQGCPSLFQYAVQVLKLSEATAYNFINVARKAVKIPALKTEIASGNLSVSKARKIVSVLDENDSQESQREWIEKAKTLPSKKLEQEVAKTQPQELTPESARFVTETRRALKLGMGEADFQNLKRVQDLESQRQKKAVNMEEAIVALARMYLESKDPLKKAERALAKPQYKARFGKQNETKDEIQNIPKKMQNMSQFTQTHARHNPMLTDQIFNPLSVPLRKHEPPLQPVARTVTTGEIETPPDFFIGFHGRSPAQRRTPIPSHTLHQANLRDTNQCTHRNSQGERCEERRWLQIHHLKPVSEGGTNELSNLATRCFSHHRMEHECPVK